MSGPTTVASATRRMVALTGLRWLPVGLLTPVLVLLAAERGLSLSQVGLVFVVHGVVIMALELPTGGLADVMGRRPVLVISAVLHLASCLLLVVATGLAGFAAAALVKAVGRTLDSGPLEAWYVDVVQRLEPHADVTTGLAWRGAADGGGLALGAVVGGLLPGLVAAEGARALLVPVLVAAGLDVVYLAALLPLVTESRPPRQVSLAATVAARAGEVPATVAGAVRLAARDQPLRVILAVAALVGVVLSGLELLGPMRFAELAGGPEEGAAVFGAVLAVSFGAAALGSIASPGVRLLLGGSSRATCAAVTAVGALAVAALAGIEAALVAGAAFSVFYAGNGAAWPLLHAVSHSRVTAAHRATVVSAIALAVAVGGVAGSLGLPRLADAAGTGVGFAAIACVAGLTALLCLRLPAASRRHRAPPLAATR